MSTKRVTSTGWSMISHNFASYVERCQACENGSVMSMKQVCIQNYQNSYHQLSVINYLSYAYFCGICGAFWNYNNGSGQDANNWMKFLIEEI